MKKFKTFELSSTKSLIKSDTVKALVSLRSEIERKVKVAFNYMDMDIDNNFSLVESINILSENSKIIIVQTESLNSIIEICNRVYHGISISKEEAMEAIETTGLG